MLASNSATADPTRMASTASGIRKAANWASCPARLPWNTTKSKRSSTYSDTLVAQAARNTLTACGAKVYALGSHTCSGNSAAFNARPIVMKPAATRIGRWSPTSWIRSSMSARFSVPVIM